MRATVFGGTPISRRKRSTRRLRDQPTSSARAAMRVSGRADRRSCAHFTSADMRGPARIAAPSSSCATRTDWSLEQSVDETIDVDGVELADLDDPVRELVHRCAHQRVRRFEAEIDLDAVGDSVVLGDRGLVPHPDEERRERLVVDPHRRPEAQHERHAARRHLAPAHHLAARLLERDVPPDHVPIFAQPARFRHVLSGDEGGEPLQIPLCHSRLHQPREGSSEAGQQRRRA